MKKNILPAIAILILISCNNSDKKHAHGKTGDKAIVDSLKESINDLHDKGMSEMYELTKLQQDTRKVVDSLNALGPNLQGPAASYKASLDSVLKDLEYAEFAMDKWMPEYYGNLDTLSDNEPERIKYLQNEITKASKITDAILDGIKKASVLLKTKP
jgi:hypothetical protein